jgi:chaperonin cofactor prefoldin
MSGLEAAAAVGGLIGLTIAAIDASIQIYDAVKDKSGIPEKLGKVSDTLPSLSELLKGAQAQFDKDQPTKQAWLEVEKDLERCNGACQELHDILESAYPKSDTSTVSRVFKNVGTLLSRKSKTAEQLLKEIYGYLEILKQRQIITNTDKLDDIKKTVDELFPATEITQNNVSGTNVGHNTGQVNNQTGGSGQQFNGPGGVYHFSSK